MAQSAKNPGAGWNNGGAVFSACAASFEPPALSARSPGSLHLAVVDADESARLAVRDIVEAESCGWTLNFYGSSADALRGIPAALPDVVLMDIWMPGVSGMECTRRLKTLLPGLRVLMLTACSGQTEILRSIAAGACGYLIKPVAPNSLVQAVKRAAKGWPVLSPEAERALVSAWQAIGTTSVSTNLSGRECDILPFLAQRQSDKEIALRLGIQPSTVNEHLKRIFRKLGVRTRADAVRMVLAQRL